MFEKPTQGNKKKGQKKPWDPCGEGRGKKMGGRNRGLAKIELVGSGEPWTRL